MVKCSACQHEEYVGFKHCDPCPLCGTMMRQVGVMMNQSTREIVEVERLRKKQQEMIVKNTPVLKSPQIIDPALEAMQSGS